MHFIREFKRFAGDTPISFVHPNNFLFNLQRENKGIQNDQ